MAPSCLLSWQITELDLVQLVCLHFFIVLSVLHVPVGTVTQLLNITKAYLGA